MWNNVYLLSLTVSGIKNIREDLRLDFYKRTVNKSFDPSNHRIKAIYGENGCGKTAVITAVQILKEVIFDKACLDDPGYQRFLNDVVNKTDQKLHLECEFYFYTQPANQVCRYSVELIRDENGRYSISSEELTYRKADYPASKVSLAFRSSEDAAGCVPECGNAAESEAAAANTADDCIGALKMLGGSICTNISTGDRASKGTDAIDYSVIDLEDLTRFIRLFKPELVAIEAERDIDEASRSSLMLDYGDLQIRLDQEGKGIRQLVALWPCLKAVGCDRIVFIDGIDRDINEVYFDRLIAFFIRYGKGQLCYTACNTSHMRDLRSYKNSIDFISSDGKVTHWRVKSNFSPDSLYKGGMIQNLPFNIEPEDFLGVL